MVDLVPLNFSLAALIITIDLLFGGALDDSPPTIGLNFDAFEKNDDDIYGAAFENCVNLEDWPKLLYCYELIDIVADLKDRDPEFTYLESLSTMFGT